MNHVTHPLSSADISIFSLETKTKSQMFCGLNPTFVEVTGEKLVRGGEDFFGPPILNRVEIENCHLNVFVRVLSEKL